MALYYIDRTTKEVCEEKVYGERALQFLYGDDLFSKILGTPLLHALCRFSLFSALYGFWQKQPATTKKIRPFIQEFGVDSSEFAEEISSFHSFNDFFCRKLKVESRPITPEKDRAIIPADGRYYFYPHIGKSDGFLIKGEKFVLEELLQNKTLSQEFEEGSMVLARLCPIDYHRFHFPCDCIPKEPHLINGWLYSVNPIALKKNIHIFTENKRIVIELDTEKFGKVICIEVGATNVGSMHQTFLPGKSYSKGDEMGYFSFGGSSLILLFQPDKIQFDEDLVAATNKGLEIRCLMGQSMGLKKSGFRIQ